MSFPVVFKYSTSETQHAFCCSWVYLSFYQQRKDRAPSGHVTTWPMLAPDSISALAPPSPLLFFEGMPGAHCQSQCISIDFRAFGPMCACKQALLFPWVNMHAQWAFFSSFFLWRKPPKQCLLAPSRAVLIEEVPKCWGKTSKSCGSHSPSNLRCAQSSSPGAERSWQEFLWAEPRPSLTMAEEKCRAVLLLIQVVLTRLGDTVGLVRRIEGLVFGVFFFSSFSFLFSPDKAPVLAYIWFLHVSIKYTQQSGISTSSVLAVWKGLICLYGTEMCTCRCLLKSPSAHLESQCLILK